MSEPQFFVTPGYGEIFRTRVHDSQAVRVGNVVHLSGQGGWDDEIRFPEDLGEEIVRAFDNVERTLALAGATWRDVVAVDSFHVPTRPDEIGDEHTTVMAEQLDVVPRREPVGERRPGLPADGGDEDAHRACPSVRSLVSCAVGPVRNRHRPARPR